MERYCLSIPKEYLPLLRAAMETHGRNRTHIARELLVRGFAKRLEA